MARELGKANGDIHRIETGYGGEAMLLTPNSILHLDEFPVRPWR